MKYTLSFGYINIINDNIAEVLVDEGVEMSLEMCEEYDEFLHSHFHGPYAVLVNRIHNYKMSYETRLHIASHQDLVAIGVVSYNNHDSDEVAKLLQQRKIDNLNLKEFHGLDMGRGKAIAWLERELSTVNANTNS
ncbi:hypothetical protein [Thalassotalea mangrovi]|uniref:STAS/SEC14 domain-containing protein n=1 Tax=Thalassotalea mangrovi TaxID=2572245 RepID=A0A4V5NUJ8_9GAMM|nr:hypothetical protein [Thalassotalea mangrovi]TKB46745.1 hypothetical protein E8M12_04090 [Thalassotalea mangrovi]